MKKAFDHTESLIDRGEISPLDIPKGLIAKEKIDKN